MIEMGRPGSLLAATGPLSGTAVSSDVIWEVIGALTVCCVQRAACKLGYGLRGGGAHHLLGMPETGLAINCPASAEDGYLF